MDDYSQQFENLLSSPLGQEMLKGLETLRQSNLEDAERAPSSEKAFGFTKQASGVKLAIGHLQYLATVPPKDEGGQKRKLK